MNIIEIILNALKLIFVFDPLLYEIIFLSLKVSLIALFISYLNLLSVSVLSKDSLYWVQMTTVMLCYHGKKK